MLQTFFQQKYGFPSTIVFLDKESENERTWYSEKENKDQFQFFT